MKLLFLLSLFYLANARRLEFSNRLPRDIWVGVQGNPGHENLNNGGWVLYSGQHMTVHSAENWAGRFWGRSWCDPQTQHCQTGDCGNHLECAGNGGAPPVSVAELTLQGAGGMDYYGISLVDGFNVEIGIEPLGGQGPGNGIPYICTRAACYYNILPECPPELQLKNGEGVVVGCNSACNAFHTDEYCCAGAHNTPETCKSTDWPVNYPKFFKDRCPDAYSYAYDDHNNSTFSCLAPSYKITFGA